MRKFPFAAALLVFSLALPSFAVQAVQLYECVFEFQTKQRDGIMAPDTGTSRATAVIPLGLKSKIELYRTDYRTSAGNTVLHLLLGADGSLSGDVNGLPNFILGGRVENGHFESARDKGTFRCAFREEGDVVFQWIPWSQWYVPTAANANEFSRRVDMNDWRHFCYEGSTEAVFAHLKNLGHGRKQKAELKVRADTGMIYYKFVSRDCVDERGGSPDSDGVCFRWGKVEHTHAIERCSVPGEPDEGDGRS